MWTKVFWVQTLERAVKTSAQTAVALLSAEGLSLLEVDWTTVGSVSVMAAFVCVLTCIASTPVGSDKNIPSLV